VVEVKGGQSRETCEDKRGKRVPEGGKGSKKWGGKKKTRERTKKRSKKSEYTGEEGDKTRKGHSTKNMKKERGLNRGKGLQTPKLQKMPKGKRKKNGRGKITTTRKKLIISSMRGWRVQDWGQNQKLNKRPGQGLGGEK